MSIIVEVLAPTYYMPFESGDGMDYKPFPVEFTRLPGGEYFTEGVNVDGGIETRGNPARFAEYLRQRDYILVIANMGTMHVYQVFDDERRPMYPVAAFSTDDSAFWTMAGIMKTVVAAGVGAWSEAGSAVASTQAAAPVVAPIQGGSMDFDFDFTDFGGYDYSSSFQPFDFSSGEGFQVFSDAQNVDYGFGAGFGDFQTSFDWSLSPDQGYNFNLTDVLNATPETTVSDFGTWWSNTALDPVKDAATKQVATKLISAAIGPAKPAPAQPQTPITTKSISSGVQDLVGAAMNVIRVRDAYSGTAVQRETEQSKTFKGQLAANPQTIAGGVNPWILALGGLALVGGIIYVSRKG